jgi:hypothetical protein
MTNVCGAAALVRFRAMLRKLVWNGLFAVFGAAAAIAARRAAAGVWKVATGEDPPTRK